MTTDYLIIGATGAVGRAFAEALFERGTGATLLVRDAAAARRTFGGNPRAEIVAGDVNDTAHLIRLAEGKSFIFHGANVSYEYWEEAMPVMTRSVIAAAEATGARVIFPANNYNYGLTNQPISEITPFNPSTKLGRVRVQLERMLQHATDQGRITTLVVRMSEIWGPYAANKMFAPVFEGALAGKKMPWLGDMSVPQQLLYSRDAGRTAADLTQLADLEDYAVFNVGGTMVESIDSWLSEIAEAAGTDAKGGRVPSPVISLLALFVPVMREVKSLAYKYENTIALDDRKLKARLDSYGQTPMPEAIRQTLDWYAERSGAPLRQAA